MSKNLMRKDMKCPGLDNENILSLSPQGDRYRPFEGPDLVASLYNQYAISIIKEVLSNSEHQLGLMYMAIAF